MIKRTVLLLFVGLIFGQDVLKTISGKEHKGEYLKTEGGKVFFISEGASSPTQVPIESIKEIISEAGRGISFQNGNSGCVSGDCKNGQGTLIRPDGRKYVGEFKNNKFNGFGTYTVSNAGEYVGEFYEGLMSGLGTLTTSSGDKYIGEHKNNKFNGFGTFTWSDGRKYVGEFIDNESNGQGTFIDGKGFEYIGEHKNNRRHGLGKAMYSDGAIYIGEWKVSLRNGFGTHTTSHGGKFVGEWKDNKFHGKGVSYGSNGEIKSGFWVNSVFQSKLPNEVVSNYLKTTYPNKFKGFDSLSSITSKYISYGSGFLISENGLVITNFHVVENAETIEIYFPNKNITKQASLRLKDVNNDLAILEIDDFNFNKISNNHIPYNLANIVDVKVGQEVFTLGFPLGSIMGSKTRLSTGRINSIYGIQEDPRLFQIGNPLQPGNSGGPLFNTKGELVGVVVSSLNAKFFYDNLGIIPQNINFAVKVSYLKNLLGMMPENDEILNRKSKISNLSMENQIEELTPFIVQIMVY